MLFRSDGDKRAAYDRFGHAAFEQGGGGPGFGAGFASSFSDIFEDLFGMAGQRGRGGGRERGADLLRVKGIVRFADRPDRPAVVQAAQHAMFAPEWLDDWPDQDHRNRLVFIVHDIPRAEILAHFAFAQPET